MQNQTYILDTTIGILWLGLWALSWAVSSDWELTLPASNWAPPIPPLSTLATSAKRAREEGGGLGSPSLEG